MDLFSYIINGTVKLELNPWYRDFNPEYSYLTIYFAIHEPQPIHLKGN